MRDGRAGSTEVGYETLRWSGDAAAPASRSARRRLAEPYRAAVPADIRELSLSLPDRVAALVEDAASEIARFDTEVGGEIAPFSSVLLRTESAASSRIENLTASARAIAEAELGARRRGNAPVIVGNGRAMAAAVALAADIDADAILAMHHALLADSAPDIAGRWRSEPVWIGGGHLSPHGAMFVPPRHELIGPAVDDLVAFVARDDVPVLAHAALAHAQFETIHPFADGNGRTGRALIHAHLRHKGSTRNVTVPVSAGLLVDTGAYFDALTAYRAGDPLPIVERLADASFAALANARHLVEDLRAVRAGWEARVRVRRRAAAWRLADLLVQHPVVDAGLVAAQLGVAPQNTYRLLRPLVDAGVLVESTDQRRHQLWRSPEVLEALDAFAARAGRRTPATR